MDLSDQICGGAENMIACETCSKNLSGKCAGCEMHAAEMHQYRAECDNHVHALFMSIVVFRRGG